MQIYILEGQEQKGPFTTEELRDQIRRGECSADSLAWHEGGAEWQPLRVLLLEVASTSQPVSELQPVANPPTLPVQSIGGGQRAWYDHSLVIIPAAICCFPIGLLPLWLTKRFATKEKIGLSAVFAFGTFFYLIAAVVLLSSPEGDYSTVDSTSQGSGNTNQSRAYTPQGKKFRLGDFSYRIGSCETRDSIGPRGLRTEASQGAFFVIVRYSVINETNRTKTVLSDDFTLRDSKGRVFRPASTALTALMMDGENNDFLLTELQPGIERDTMTAFEVPFSSGADPMILTVPEKGFGSRKVEVLVRLDGR